MSDTPAEPMDGPSAGTLLRQAREAAGMQPASLAVALKVPLRQLEALEQDRIDLLPDTVFARALAASVCRHLKADPAPVLSRLPQGRPVSRLGDRTPINEPFRTPGESSLAIWRDRLGRPSVVAALVLLLAALVLVALPLVQTGAPSGDVSPLPPATSNAGAPSSADTPASPASPTPSAEPPATPGVVTESVPLPGLPPASAPPPAPPSPAPTPAPASSGAVVPPPVTAVAVASPLAEPAATATPQLALRARAASWVSVTDARGASVLRRELGAGEAVTVTGVPPLAVTVGSAAATEVSVRGRPLDLAPLTRDNVARFEVK